VPGIEIAGNLWVRSGSSRNGSPPLSEFNVSNGYGQLEGMSPDVPSYCLSKHALNGLTIMLAAALHEDKLAVNSMWPGWMRTNMGGSGAPRSVEEGADTAVWLAHEAAHDLTGKFFRVRKDIPW
jgi:NAD(P)-dependent dehydrogenase (short-subunit alcohol dehydrogenase family)